MGIEIEIEPNPFAAGLGEHATVHYRVPFEAEGELHVYGGDGRHIRELQARGALVSGQVTWDGRSDHGQLQPVGIYVLQVKLYQPAERAQLATIVVAR